MADLFAPDDPELSAWRAQEAATLTHSNTASPAIASLDIPRPDPFTASQASSPAAMSLPPPASTMAPAPAPTAPIDPAPAPAAPPLAPAPSAVGPIVRKPTRVALPGEDPLGPNALDSAADAKRLGAEGASEEAVEKRRKADVEAAQREVEGLRQANEERGRLEAEQRTKRQAMAQAEEGFAKVQAQRREEIQKRDLTGFWEDRSAGSRVLASLSMALGGIGAGLTGGPNQAFEVIKNAMNHDAALKEKRLRAHLDGLNLDQEQFNHQMELGRAELGIDKQAMAARLADDLAMRAAKSKEPDAEANAAAAKAKLDAFGAAAAQEAADRYRNIAEKKIDIGLKRQEIGIHGSEVAGGNRLKDAEIRHLDAETAAVGAKSSATQDPLTMLGSNGKPAVYKDENGAVTPIRARSQKSAEELANYATKAPALDRSLKRLGEIATGPESERLKAIASGDVGRLRALVVDAGAVLDSTSGKTSVALINLNREKVSDEKYFNGLKDPGKLFANAREAARQGYADALVAHTNIPRAHSTRLVNDLLGRDAGDTGGAGGGGKTQLSSGQIAALNMEIHRNGPRSAEARSLLQRAGASVSP